MRNLVLLTTLWRILARTRRFFLVIFSTVRRFWWVPVSQAQCRRHFVGVIWKTVISPPKFLAGQNLDAICGWQQEWLGERLDASLLAAHKPPLLTNRSYNQDVVVWYLSPLGSCEWRHPMMMFLQWEFFEGSKPRSRVNGGSRCHVQTVFYSLQLIFYLCCALGIVELWCVRSSSTD